MCCCSPRCPALSGDVNPIHLDQQLVSGTPFGGRIMHGMPSGAFIFAALAMALPGPGTIYVGQSLKFQRPGRLGDTLTVALQITEKKRRTQVTLNVHRYQPA